ncbi:hypothetical protein HYZ99_04840 [Candidatus Peregrinibacteria bacterium]|nr:hypothetical protein [Candidatus Peregrinibacteria bacterium]
MNLLFPALLGLAAALFPQSAEALSIPINFCGMGGLACTGGGAGGLAGYVERVFVNALGIGFVGLAGAMFFYYAVQLITGSNDESTVTEAKTAYGHAIAGGAIVSLAGAIVHAFTPGVGGPGSVLVNPIPVEIGFANAIEYFRLIIGTALIINTVVQGIRLILAQGDEAISAARKRVLFGFIGVAIVLLANALVIAAYPPAGANSDVINSELVGLANFFLTFFGFLCVVTLVVAGLMLVVSVDEGLKDKAKTVAKTAIIALAVIFSAFVIVNAFITL